MPRKPASTRPDPDEDQNPKSGDSAAPSAASEGTSEPAPQPEAEPQSQPDPQPQPAASRYAQPSAGSGFFAWLRRIDLRREHGWIGGVCAGIAARLGIDPLIVRGIAVVIAVLGGPALLVYAAAWLLLPDSDDRIHLEEIVRGRFEPAVAGIAAMIVLSFVPIWRGFWFGMPFLDDFGWGELFGRTLWTLALVGLLVWFVVWIARRSSSGSSGSVPTRSTASAFVASTDTVSAPTGSTSATRAPEPDAGVPAAEHPAASAPASEPAPAEPALTVPLGTAPDPAAEPDIAAWREQQAQVRAEQTAFRSQGERRDTELAAAERARAERAEVRRLERERWEASRSHPLYSLVVIGLALMAGGLATVVFAAGAPTPAAIVVGLATAIAVLAIGIIINGVRGKRAGGAGGVAAVLLIPLLFSTITTAGGTAEVQWGPYLTLAPTSSESYVVGAGRVDLDLTGIEFDGGQGHHEVDLRLGAGDVLVMLPEGVTVDFTGTVGAGEIEAGRFEESTRVGPVENVTATFGPDSADAPTLHVSVQLGAGHVAVVTEGARR